jgi:hypothetical protein
MNKQDLRYLVRSIIKESFENVQEGGSHDDSKEMDKAIAWIKNNMPDIRIEDIKNGYKICPPKELSDECFTAHRGGKGRFDLYRFLSKAYGITKREIEDGVSSNRKLNLLALELPEVKLGKKIWLVDKENEILILQRNQNTTKSIFDLTEEEFEKVYKYL